MTCASIVLGDARDSIAHPHARSDFSKSVMASNPSMIAPDVGGTLSHPTSMLAPMPGHDRILG